MQPSRKVGTILTSGLLALAVALAMLQAAIVAQTARPARPVTSSSPTAQPWSPSSAPSPRLPSEREGRTPETKPPREQHRAPLRAPGVLPQVGPRAPRKAVA
jgi:hypothetical protein